MLGSLRGGVLFQGLLRLVSSGLRTESGYVWQRRGGRQCTEHRGAESLQGQGCAGCAPGAGGSALGVWPEWAPGGVWGWRLWGSRKGRLGESWALRPDHLLPIVTVPSAVSSLTDDLLKYYQQVTRAVLGDDPQLMKVSGLA